MTLQAKRRKKCRACREWFTAWSSMDRACSPKCAVAVVEQDKAEQAKREHAERKRALKTKADLRKEAQVAFNAYIRERDRDEPCISCGRSPDDTTLITGSKRDAGHYRSTGSCPELRFSEWNCFSQCVYCNRHLSGNVVEFRIGLRQRIGDEALEWLEGEHPPAKYTRDDYIRIRDEYRRKTRELQRGETGAHVRAHSDDQGQT